MLALRILADPTVVVVRCAMHQVISALDVCWPRVRLYAFDVNRNRDAISLYTLLCVMTTLPCAWAWMYSPGLSSCRDYVRLTCAGFARTFDVVIAHSNSHMPLRVHISLNCMSVILD